MPLPNFDFLYGLAYCWGTVFYKHIYSSFNLIETQEATVLIKSSWNFIRMFVLMIY